MGAQGVAGQGSEGQCSAREAGCLGREEKVLSVRRGERSLALPCSYRPTVLSSHDSAALVSPLLPHLTLVTELRSVHTQAPSVQRKGKWQAALDLLEGRENGPTLGCMA